jgi:hypothetical protein
VMNESQCCMQDEQKMMQPSNVDRRVL